MVEKISSRKIVLCCLQETKLNGRSVCMINVKDSRYKCFWIRNDNSTGGVAILLAEEWVENFLENKRISNRIYCIKVNVGDIILSILSINPPQVGLGYRVNVAFYNERQCTVAGNMEIHFLCWDFSGHIGST